MNLNVIVKEKLLELGLKVSQKGYHYIKEGVIRCIEEPALLHSMSQHLYPAIADTFNTTFAAAERAIRHAIDGAWDGGNIEAFYKHFGKTGKPTNKEFIMRLAEEILTQREQECEG